MTPYQQKILARAIASYTSLFETEEELTLEQCREELTRENDTLRAIAAKVMPCMYCGVDSIAKCPRGFPGCGLADDISCYQDTLATALIAERKRVEVLERALVRDSLYVDALTAILEKVPHVYTFSECGNRLPCHALCAACAFDALKKGETHGQKD